MNVNDIDAQIAKLTKQRAKVVKDEKKNALSEVKN